MARDGKLMRINGLGAPRLKGIGKGGRARANQDRGAKNVLEEEARAVKQLSEGGG